MTGTTSLDSRTAEAIEKLLGIAYPPGLYDPGLLEDLILATPERENYSSIGTDGIKQSRMLYLFDNLFWVSVCLFVNKDFRDCFHDAILIEKALLQVNEEEYADFRDDMVLAGDEDADMGDRFVRINLARYSSSADMAFRSRLEGSKQKFWSAGMMDAYEELSDGFDAETKASVSYVIHNMLYMVNALDKNGVFNKYVHLVVDSVRDQLSAPAK